MFPPLLCSELICNWICKGSTHSPMLCHPPKHVHHHAIVSIKSCPNRLPLTHPTPSRCIGSLTCRNKQPTIHLTTCNVRISSSHSPPHHRRCCRGLQRCCQEAGQPDGASTIHGATRACVERI